jgi:hypothetical protein
MSPRDSLTIKKALSVLHSPTSFTQAADTLQQLLETYDSQLVGMPTAEYQQVLSALTSSVYVDMFEDVDISVASSNSPLTQLQHAISRILPATHISSANDCETAATRVFQRLMERQATLGWYMVHPRIDPHTAPLTKELVQCAFTLQNSLGCVERGIYPVVFALDYPVLCSLQSWSIGNDQVPHQQTFISVVKSGFLRLTVMPWYMFGYDGFDGLVWSQKGFRVRVGGFQLPLQAIALYDLCWLLTDYRLERCVAYNPETGAVVKHNARVLTH